MRAGSLALGQQQHIEIIKALWKGSRVLILDEPTSMLTPQGIADLQKVLLALKSNGLAIIFITHKLHEAIAIGDRITILKQGRVVGALEPARAGGRTPADLQRRIVSIMFGEAAGAVSGMAELRSDVERSAPRPPVSGQRDAGAHGCIGQGRRRPVRRVGHLASASDGGEILGIAGVDGNGQRALAEVIAGQRRVTAGDIRVGGADVTALAVSRAPATRPALRHGRPAG